MTGVTTFGEKGRKREIGKGINRHRDPLQCTIGALAYMMAHKLDSSREHHPLFEEIKHVTTMQTANSKGRQLPTWAGHYLVDSVTYGDRQSVTANVMDNDWKAFAKASLSSIVGTQWHSLRHTTTDKAERMCMDLNELLSKHNHKGSISEIHYQNKGTTHQEIFAEAEWPKPYK